MVSFSFKGLTVNFKSLLGLNRIYRKCTNVNSIKGELKVTNPLTNVSQASFNPRKSINFPVNSLPYMKNGNGRLERK